MTRSGTLPTLPVIAAFAATAVVLAVAIGFVMAPRAAAGTRPLETGELGERVLIIAPHPDDETLVTGGTIHRLLASGASVRLVIVSAGDGYYRATRRLVKGPVDAAAYRTLGDTRHTEGAGAVAELGLAPADVTFLGYPDKGIYDMWDAAWDPSTAHEGAPGSTDVPYDWARRPQAASCGQNLAEDLVDVVRDFRPDTVISPDVHETHSDHAAIGAFTMYALDEAAFTGLRLTDVVHYKLFPSPKAFLPGSVLDPPPALTGDGSTWRSLSLDRADEQAKRRALEKYSSQLAVGDLAVYMRAFVRRNELFKETAPARLVTTTGDERPGDAAAGTVAVTPRPAVPPLYPYAARVESLRMVRGPHTLWVGVVTERPVSASLDYRVSLRLVGGDIAPGRVDVLVRDGVAVAIEVCADSIVPDSVTAGADGHTMWVSVPASVLDGRTNVLLGSSAGPEGKPPFRTAWRDIAL
jgi:N-acetyl-1-D-myo-inositol-2-amino-2-deoxy-alpha-D-glucopyranoside deacetylase